MLAGRMKGNIPKLDSIPLPGSDENDSPSSSPKIKTLKNWFSKKKNENSDLKHDKDSFIKSFTETVIFTEFRLFAAHDNALNYFEFCESFSGLEQLNAKYKIELVKSKKGNFSEADVGDVYQSMARFLGADGVQNLTKMKPFELPPWLIPYYLNFFANFLGPGAPKWVYLSEPCLQNIKKILETGKFINLMSNVFEAAADEVLMTMFSSWFPRFLAYRYNTESPVLKKILIPPTLEPLDMSRTKSTSSTGSIERIKSEESSLGMKFFRRKSGGATLKVANTFFEVVYTKECMVRVLYDDVHLTDFIKVIKADHCKENFLFFEAFSNLELLLLNNIPEFNLENKVMEPTKAHPNAKKYSRFIARFIHKVEAQDIQPGVGVIIPKQIYPHFMTFYSSFILPGGPNEVNITDKSRRRIAETLAVGVDVPATLFDGAADEVIGLLYLNTFKRFVKERMTVPPSLLK